MDEDINEFQEYLISKNIDFKKFNELKPVMYKEWSSLFLSIHPNSFTEQKKFLINKIRREMPYQNY